MANYSSIHIQPTTIGEFFHNSREKKTVNSIGDVSQNYCNRKALKALELYKKDLEKKEKLYYERMGRKLPKNTKTLFSAIVNLNEKHTEKDVEKVANYLKEKLGVEIYQISIHKDEGHKNEKGEFVQNLHGHIVFGGLDNEARSIKRNKLNIHFLRQMQTDIAKILSMERGQKRELGQKKRLDTYEYKKAMKLQNEAIKELTKNIKLDDNKIQKYLKIIDKKISELTNVFGNVKKDDVLNLFNKFLKSLKLQNEKLEKENEELKQKLGAKNFELQETKFSLEKAKKENKELFEQLQKAHSTIKNIKQTNTVKILEENKALKEENKQLKLTVNDLKNEISNLRKQMIQINKNLETENKEKIFDKEDYQYISKLKKELKANTIQEIYQKIQSFKKEKSKKLGIDF